MSAESRLTELGITLPPVPKAAGLYAPLVQTGNLVFIAGQVPVVDGKPASLGKCGDAVSIEHGAELARQCSLQALALVRAHLGTLDRVVSVPRVAGYVAAAPGFTDAPLVVNGASQVLLDLFGEPGRHARVAIGVAELPLNVPVEVEYLFEVSAG
ncbi:RidA family protein [bacterium]|nr:RidA family protein [bacterium]